ncbi:hypothetical protein HDV03_004582 [Kappamyces sp. JEL0829]|nr:hypothetical protein HDV03_004582 [Kappamyces sp. JEL0829]
MAGLAEPLTGAKSESSENTTAAPPESVDHDDARGQDAENLESEDFSSDEDFSLTENSESDADSDLDNSTDGYEADGDLLPAGHLDKENDEEAAQSNGDENTPNVSQEEVNFLRFKSQFRLKFAWDRICEKYGKSFEGQSDEIDLATGKVVVDRGCLKNAEVTEIGSTVVEVDEKQVEDAWASPATRQKFIESQSLGFSDISESLAHALEAQETDDLTRSETITKPLSVNTGVVSPFRPRRPQGEPDDLISYTDREPEEFPYHSNDSSYRTQSSPIVPTYHPEFVPTYVSPQPHTRTVFRERPARHPETEQIMVTGSVSRISSLRKESFSAIRRVPPRISKELVLDDDYGLLPVPKRVRKLEILPSHDPGYILLPEPVIVSPAYRQSVYIERQHVLVQQERHQTMRSSHLMPEGYRAHAPMQRMEYDASSEDELVL